MNKNKGRPGEDVCLIVHDFEPYPPLTKVVVALQEKIKGSVSTAHDPKLGNHVTIIPPFFADKTLQFGILFGAKLKWSGFNSVGFDATVINTISFFENGDCDYAYLPTTFPDDYNSQVTELRTLVGEHGRWYYDPIKEKWVPHITISEGFELKKKLPKELTEKAEKNKKTHVALPVEPPKLLRKIEGGWEVITFESLRSQ